MPCINTSNQRSIGWIVGESSPAKSLVIFERSDPPRAGEYVVAENPEGCVLGIVETVWSGHRMLPPSVTDPRAVDHIAQWTLMAGGEDIYNRGSVRWLALLDPLLNKRKVIMPKTPLTPGSKIYSADPRSLSQIFTGGGRRGWIRIGNLVNNPTVGFHINANSLMRHLAILAVTGGGKSNTVCILSKEIVGRLCGTMIVFDMHGEYAQLNLEGVRIKKHSPPKLNPLNISIRELYKLLNISDAAIRQKKYLKWAWKVSILTYLKSTGATTNPYGDIINLAKSLLEFLYDIRNNNQIANIIYPKEEKHHSTLVSTVHGKTNILAKLLKSYLPRGVPPEVVAELLVVKENRPPRQLSPEALDAVIDKLETFHDEFSDIIDVSSHQELVEAIPPCHLTVFDLSEIDENMADAVLSHYLRRLLQERKNAKKGGEGYPYPAIVVIEEAHVLVPRDGNTLTKYWAGRIAREGRKFGVGLVLVSQRPKNVDPNVLSQTNNKIVLRTVEPEDIRYIQRASEEMSDDIAGLLPMLNPGEAVVLGKMATLPGLVKIDECREEEKPFGGDLPVVDMWRKAKLEASSIEKEIEESW